MEASHQHHGGSPDWGDDGVDAVPDWDSVELGFPRFLQDWPSTDDFPTAQGAFSDAQAEVLQLRAPTGQPAGEAQTWSPSPPELVFGWTAAIAPSDLPAPSDVIWSPTSGSSASTSPSTAWETPHRSPYVVVGQSPVFPYASPIDMSPYLADQAGQLISRLQDEATSPELTGFFPTQVSSGVQQLPSQATATHHSSASQGRPVGVSARKWRYQTKPEKCPVCDKGHSYWGEVKKHIVANHPERAAEFNVSMEQFPCRWCPKSYGRQDRLMRHLTAKHGRPKGRTKCGY